MTNQTPPLHVIFDPTAEIFASDAKGSFWLPLTTEGRPGIDTEGFDEARIMISLCYSSPDRTVDLDRAYVELRGAFDLEPEHWFKLAEIEPVVPAYGAGQTFDGWIVLPVFSTRSAFGLSGSGFSPRARLQVRTQAYFVS